MKWERVRFPYSLAFLMMNLTLKLLVLETEEIDHSPARVALTPRFEACDGADPGDAALAQAYTRCIVARPVFGDVGLALALLFAGFYCYFEDPEDPDTGLCLFLGGKMVGTVFLPEPSLYYCEENTLVDQFFSGASSAVVFGPVFKPCMPTIRTLADADSKRRQDIMKAHFLLENIDDDFPVPSEHVAASLAAQSSPVTSILRELLLPHTKPRRKMSDLLFITVGILCTVAVIAIIVYVAVYNSRR